MPDLALHPRNIVTSEQGFLIAGTFLVLSTIEGQVVQPVLVGRRLDVSPLVVLIGLWFGGWMWGVAGVALAMPMLVSIKAALHEVRLSRVRGQHAVVARDV